MAGTRGRGLVEAEGPRGTTEKFPGGKIALCCAVGTCVCLPEGTCQLVQREGSLKDG